MDYTLNTDSYSSFLESLPKNSYPSRLKLLKPFLQKLTEQVVTKIYPNETLEWFSPNTGEINNSTDQGAGETWYLINKELPGDITKISIGLIPANRFAFLKTSYIKATLKLTYTCVHSRAGDSYDSWMIEILQNNTVKCSFMSSDPGIYVLDNSNDPELKEIINKILALL